jgi:2-methylisocitrate lyase-like PEP mutase family enzyme
MKLCRYCDVEVACHVVSLLEQAGASAVVMEDQKRPRRCGHFEGKQLLDCGDFVEKLQRVLETR